MAITQSLGYGGSVGEDDLPLWVRSFAGKYGVLGAEDWKVTLKPAADRTLVVAPGAGFGHTVIDTNDAAEVSIQLDPLASGTRWDMIRAHRDWAGSGGTTTFGFLTGTSNQLATFSTRDRAPGDVDDQPLALVRVDGGVGGGVIGAVIDLRVWVAAGGAFANDELVLQYMDELGTSILIGTTRCDRIIDATSGSSIPVWKRTSISASPRRWTTSRADRPGSDLYGTAQAPLCTIVLPASAPAGAYLASFQYVGGPGSGGAMPHNLIVIGPSGSRVIPAHFDGIITTTVLGSVPFTHAGGAGTFQLAAWSGASGRDARVFNNDTYLDVYWLGS